MKRVLFVIPTQYGYNTDYYKYCELLSYTYNYDVTYLGIYRGFSVRQSKKVHVINLTVNQLLWKLQLLTKVVRLNKKEKFDKIIIYSYPLCSLMLLFTNREKVIMDIRTSAINGRYKSRVINLFMMVESLFFKTTSVISDGVASFLNIKSKNIVLLPLGADKGGLRDRAGIEGLHLLYVGTFYDRHIENTVIGTKKYIDTTPKGRFLSFSYDIVGNGSVEEIQKITEAINNNGLNDYVRYCGEKRFEELIPFFDANNIGVSYIPLTDYYDCQPPTKTFEYLLNSMAVLATPTSENKYVINSTNGILSQDDSPEAFAEALCRLESCSYNYTKIYNQSLHYSWDNVIQKFLIPIIEG